MISTCQHNENNTVLKSQQKDHTYRDNNLINTLTTTYNLKPLKTAPPHLSVSIPSFSIMNEKTNQ